MNALDIAESIAERLEVDRIYPESTNFASGAAGDALFFLALAQARSSERWARAAHRSLKAAATSGKATTSGLFTGLAGLLFVSAYAARIDSRYGALRDQCASALVGSGATNPPLRSAERAKEYDIVSGVAGLHAALLYAGRFDDARGTRTYLEWLVADDERWRCEHEIYEERGPANDLGIAHGIAGVLSVLASDDEVHSELLQRLGESLWSSRVPGTTLWPSSIGSRASEPTRVAWCYGNPGVGMALLRVGERLRSDAIIGRARDALLAAVDLPRESWGQIDHALCHGAAGNGLILEIGARALGENRLSACSDGLIAEVCDAYDDDARYGYRSWNNLNECWIDDPSLMTGAAGIGLALATLEGGADASWTASFALAQLANLLSGTTH